MTNPKTAKLAFLSAILIYGTLGVFVRYAGQPSALVALARSSIGTPAATTRGFTVEDMPIIADCIRLIADDFDANRLKVEEAVVRLTAKHPMY